ncbi:restriction endonuclease subunit S, partial [Gallibacterium anatis]|uniref:restriction endonuclease subunit S n=1 Tax=Gallibacterium anatis TaxID=750 RepID=UPI000B27E469
MKFTNYKLNDLGKIITGKTPPSKVQNAFTQVGIPFVTPSDMNGGRFVEKTNRSLSDEGLNVVRNNLIPENSVAVSCIGSDMGKAIIIKTTSVTNQQINSIIVNEKFNYLYIYYVLSTKQQELKNIASGSATPILNKTQFGNIEIKLPDRKYQDKVSNILDKFDNKIELNTQTNQTLEQIAQAIFKHWFIDFAPVHAKANALARGETIEQAELAAMACLSGKTVDKITALKAQDPTAYHQLQQTAAAFPSEFVETEMGQVPKGWEVKPINEICSIVYGKGLPKNQLKSSGYPVYGANGVIGYYDQYLYKTRQVLIGCRGTVGQVYVSQPYSYITSNSLIIEDTKTILNLYFLELYLKNLDLSVFASGSVQPQITIQNLSRLKIFIPNKEILDLFSSLVEPMYQL